MILRYVFEFDYHLRVILFIEVNYFHFSIYYEIFNFNICKDICVEIITKIFLSFFCLYMCSFSVLLEKKRRRLKPTKRLK